MKIDSGDSTLTVHDYLLPPDMLLSLHFCQVMLDRWYLVDKYIDERITNQADRDFHKNWIREIRQAKKGDLYIRIDSSLQQTTLRKTRPAYRYEITISSNL